MTIKIFNATFVIASASLLSLVCSCIKSKRKEGKILDERHTESGDEGDIEIYFISTPRNKKILRDAPGLRIRPWGFSNPHFASLLAQLRPSPFTMHWGANAVRRVSTMI